MRSNLHIAAATLALCLATAASAGETGLALPRLRSGDEVTAEYASHRASTRRHVRRADLQRARYARVAVAVRSPIPEGLEEVLVNFHDVPAPILRRSYRVRLARHRRFNHRVSVKG